MKNNETERDLGLRIGVIVRRYREHKRLTQAQLAKSANVTQAEISYIESGKRSHLKTLDHVAFALGMRLSEMMRRAEDIGTGKAVAKQTREFIGKLEKADGRKPVSNARKPTRRQLQTA